MFSRKSAYAIEGRDVSKERHWRDIVKTFKELTLKLKLLSPELLRWLSEMEQIFVDKLGNK